MNKTLILILSLIILIKYSLTTWCRDGSWCPGQSTCCLTPSGVGCCPYQNAVRCGDGIHCCPYGFICGAGGSCYRSEDSKNTGDTIIPSVEFIRKNRKSE